MGDYLEHKIENTPYELSKKHDENGFQYLSRVKNYLILKRYSALTDKEMLR